MGKIIAIANQKGGVGKTTTAINLAASLALGGQEILIVDSDPQGNASSGLGVIDGSRGLYDVYARGLTIEDAMVRTEVDGLWLVPSTVDLIASELELVDRPDRELILKDRLAAIRDRFRFIFIDCPPSLGLLTLNALVAADSLMVPVQCEYYALEGLGRLTRTISLVRDSYNPALELEGIVRTMYDPRNTLSRQVEEELRTHFGAKLYNTAIPRNVTLAEAPSHGKPAILYDARARGAQAYLSLAKEMLGG